MSVRSASTLYISRYIYLLVEICHSLYKTSFFTSSIEPERTVRVCGVFWLYTVYILSYILIGIIYRLLSKSSSFTSSVDHCQAVRLCSLIWPVYIVSYLLIVRVYRFLLKASSFTSSVDPDQTAQMCGPVWLYTVHSSSYSLAGRIYRLSCVYFVYSPSVLPLGRKYDLIFRLSSVMSSALYLRSLVWVYPICSFSLLLGKAYHLVFELPSIIPSVGPDQSMCACVLVRIYPVCIFSYLRVRRMCHLFMKTQSSVSNVDADRAVLLCGLIWVCTVYLLFLHARGMQFTCLVTYIILLDNLIWGYKLCFRVGGPMYIMFRYGYAEVSKLFNIRTVLGCNRTGICMLYCPIPRPLASTKQSYIFTLKYANLYYLHGNSKLLIYMYILYLLSDTGHLKYTCRTTCRLSTHGNHDITVHKQNFAIDGNPY